PYGWLEGYDPAWTPNTTDAEGRRYSYGNQPHIALWNLSRLSEALLPIVGKDELEAGLRSYGDVYQEGMTRALAHKLGLASLERDGDHELMQGLFKLLGEVETDFTLFFRNLASVETPVDDLPGVFYDKPSAGLRPWLERYLTRAKADEFSWEDRKKRMNAVNPKYVPRNYLAQQAIDAMT